MPGKHRDSPEIPHAIERRHRELVVRVEPVAWHLWRPFRSRVEITGHERIAAEQDTPPCEKKRHLAIGVPWNMNHRGMARHVELVPTIEDVGGRNARAAQQAVCDCVPHDGCGKRSPQVRDEPRPRQDILA